MQAMTIGAPVAAGAPARSDSAPVTFGMREQVTLRLRSTRSRALLARSLGQIVEDAFLIDRCATIPHLRDALDQPISAVTETAIDTLVDELADLLDLLPETSAQAWERARLEADLGFE